MAKLLGAHWPHLVFVAVGVLAFLWTAYRPERPSQRLGEPLPDPDPARPPRAHVKRTVARRGLLALGPLLGAVATGAVLYGMAVAGASAASAVIWVHSGLSALALLLVVYKVSDLGAARIRRAFTREGLHELISIALGLLSVPLAVTGVALLISPSTGSPLAYAHLISSAWWTGLLGWHLRRYLVSSLRTALGDESGAAAAAPRLG